MLEIDLLHPTLDEEDHLILMYCQAHFSGSFELMISYYKNEGKGCHPSIYVEDIEKLASLEKRTQASLAGLCLSVEEKKLVEQSKNCYNTLRSASCQKDPLSLALIDLILTEEEEPEQEILNIVSTGQIAVEPLVRILKEDQLHDPLFPGYGLTPAYAAVALGHLGAACALHPIFEALKLASQESYNLYTKALQLLGDNARSFLKNKIASHPLSQDNTIAAGALAALPTEETTSAFFLEQLQKMHASAPQDFLVYLVIGCSDLKDLNKRRAFSMIFPLIANPVAKEEANFILTCWKRQEH